MKLNKEQVKKAAIMMLEAAEYGWTMAGPTIFFPCIHTEKEDREENLQAVTEEVTELVKEHGTMLDKGKLYRLLNDHLLKQAYLNVSDATLESLLAKYHSAPIYQNRKGKMVTLFNGLWCDGNMEKLNLIYIDDYTFTNQYADKERMKQMLNRRTQ